MIYKPAISFFVGPKPTCAKSNADAGRSDLLKLGAIAGRGHSGD